MRRLWNYRKVLCFIVLVLASTGVVFASSGSIIELRVSNDGTSGYINVSCPGQTGYDWQLAVDDWGNIFNEQTTPDGNFGISASNGNHTLKARLHCANESWDQASYAEKSFSVSGGQPNQPSQPSQSNNNGSGSGGGSTPPKYAGAVLGNGAFDLNTFCIADGEPGANSDGSGCIGYGSLNWQRVCAILYDTYDYYTVNGPNDVRCGNQGSPAQANVSQSAQQDNNGGSNSGSSGSNFQPSNDAVACNQNAPVSVGQPGRVTPGSPNRLRSSPGGNLIGSIPGGGQFDVVGGPQCVGGYRWWQVNYNGTTGWTADGDGNTYWIESVSGNNGSGSGSLNIDPINFPGYDKVQGLITYVTEKFNANWPTAANRVWNGIQFMVDCSIPVAQAVSVAGIVAGTVTIETPPGDVILITAAAIHQVIGPVDSDQLAQCGSDATDFASNIVQYWRGDR